jgi:hypothetical protein
MSADWIPVFIGSYTDVLVLREFLDANGIPCLAPDAGDLGAYPDGNKLFAVQLLVPPDRLEDATRLIPASKRGGIPRSTMPPHEAR